MKSKEKYFNESINVDNLCKQIKVMRPGAVIQFIAKQFGMSSTQFLAKYALSIAKMAIKNGWVKTKDIGSSIVDFAQKNKEDVTGIDFSKAEIDPSTTSFKCIFDNIGGKLSQFMNELEDELKDEGKEIQKADKKLHADVKDAGVDMNDQEIDDNGIAVANVIDDDNNRDESGEELKKRIEQEIKKDKTIQALNKISSDLKKSNSKVKVDKKYENMTDEQIAKLDDQINKKIRSRSEASKKNDAFRSKLKRAIQKGVAEEFRNSVKTSFVMTGKLKKAIAINMKPGLAVEKIKEPRAICISVKCSNKDFQMVLREAKSSTKIIDVTNGSKDKNIQKVIDYIKKVLQDKIGKEKLGNKIYAYLKNVGENCLLYVFAGVKQDKLDESLINEDSLDADIANIKVNGNKISGFGTFIIDKIIKKSGDKPSDIYKLFARNPSSSASIDMAKDKIKSALLHLLTSYDKDINYVNEDWLKGFNREQQEILASIGEKLLPNANGAVYNSFKSISQLEDVATEISKLDKMEDGLKSLRHEQFGEQGFVEYTNGKVLPAFSYQTWIKDIDSLNDMFADGKLDAKELAKIGDIGKQLDAYAKWAYDNAFSDDPLVKQKIAMINAMVNKYDDVVKSGQSLLDQASQAGDARTGATETSKKMANDEEVKKAAGGWKQKLGLDKAFTAIGWARLAAKTTGIILNKGKTIVDALGSMAVRFKEDANAIAQMNFLLTNGENNDSKFQDSKFSVRFSLDDFKWHATCLDDRKMKFNEEDLVKKALGSKEGKKFKAACLKKWTSIFKPEDETRHIIPYVMKNFENLGLKANDSNVNKIVDTISRMEDNFGKIESQFK